MFAFLGALFTFIFIITLVGYVAFYIVVAIFRAIYNSIERSKYTGSNYSYTEYKPSPQPSSGSGNPYNIDMEYAIPPKGYGDKHYIPKTYGDNDYMYYGSDEVIHVGSDNTQEDYDSLEEEGLVGAAYCCPECFEPYDGIHCESCGFMPKIGYEEISDDERFAEDFTAMMLFNEEENRRRAEKEENEEELFDDFSLDGNFDSEFDDVFDDEFC